MVIACEFGILSIYLCIKLIEIAYKEELSEAKEFPETVSLEALPHFSIRPSRGWISLRLKDIWEYRELLYFLVWRDIKVQ